MYWSEKVDLVKKRFSATDFKDPFESGGGIIEKIIRKLFESTWANFFEAENKATLLKHGQLIKTCTVKQLDEDQLPHLHKDKNYWLLLIMLPKGPNLQVYDCKFEPLKELLYFSSGLKEQQFCIADKKYSWLLFFNVDRIKDVVEIYKTGNIDMLTA
ncbi:hypothetical protein [Ferruginibacter profundus]